MKEEISLKDIERLLKEDKTERAKMLFDQFEEQLSVEYFMLKGKIEQKYQNWGGAINAFNKVLEIDPSNKVASNNLHLINNILSFWNPDMLNP